MSKKNPLSPYHLRSKSPSRIFEPYDDKNEERHLLIILATKVSRWKQKPAPVKQPWFMKPESTVLSRLQRMDKYKMFTKKTLKALQDDSTLYINPTYVRWNHDEKGVPREVEYLTDIKKYYREEVNAAMKSLAKAKERLSSTKSYTQSTKIPKTQPLKKKSFLDALYSKAIIEEVENENKSSSSSSSEDDNRMEEGQPDNIGIPPGGQEEFKTPDESDEESNKEQASTQETTKTSNTTHRTVEEMMELMQTRIDTLEKTVKHQGFQYELALNKAQTEAPRKVQELLKQVEEASIKIQEQNRQIASITKIKVEDFVKNNKRIITETTDKIMQESITRLTNEMDRTHEQYRQTMIGEVQSEAMRLTQTMKNEFQTELNEIKNRIEEEHESKLMSQLDSYSAETINERDCQLEDLWGIVMSVNAELQQGNITLINRPLQIRLEAIDADIAKAKDEVNDRIEAVKDILKGKIKDVKDFLESKIALNERKGDLTISEQHDALESKIDAHVSAIGGSIDLMIDSKITKSIENNRAAEDARLTSHAKMIEELKNRMTVMEEEIPETAQDDESTEPTPPTSAETHKGRFHNQPTFIPGSATRNLFATPVPERAAAQLANEMATNMTANVSKFEKATLHHDLHKTTIDVADLEDYYENLQGLCRSYQIPLVPRDEIRNARSCMPLEVSLMPDATQSIAKQALYNKINSSFTEEPVLLRNMITQNDEQDGYKVIYQIMSTFCQDLMDYPPTWGPPIDPNKDLWAYSKQLKRFRTQHGHKTSYTDDDVAFEIIQQAMKVPKYKSLAQTLMASYVTTRQNKLDMTNFEKFAIISTLARIDMREPGNAPPEDAIINKGYAKDEGTSRPYDNGPRGRYPPPRMAKNRVNCDACKTFGHNVPEQCCHFSAKLYHAQKYMEQHPEKAKTNATQYEKRYDANIVKHMIANKTRLAAHLPPDQQDSYIDHLIDDMMTDDYSSNDGISQLTGTTEQLSISTPSREQC